MLSIFDGVQGILFLLLPESFTGTQIMTICCHNSEGIFHSNNGDPVSSLGCAQGISIGLELATFDSSSPGGSRFNNST